MDKEKTADNDADIEKWILDKLNGSLYVLIRDEHIKRHMKWCAFIIEYIKYKDPEKSWLTDEIREWYKNGIW